MKDGWHIEYDPKPIPDRRHDYNFWHDDFDGTNGLCGTAESPEAAKESITELIATWSKPGRLAAS